VHSARAQQRLAQAVHAGRAGAVQAAAGSKSGNRVLRVEEQLARIYGAAERDAAAGAGAVGGGGIAQPQPPFVLRAPQAGLVLVRS
jgi:hypothetical protein